MGADLEIEAQEEHVRHGAHAVLDQGHRVEATLGSLGCLRCMTKPTVDETLDLMR